MALIIRNRPANRDFSCLGKNIIILFLSDTRFCNVELSTGVLLVIIILTLHPFSLEGCLNWKVINQHNHSMGAVIKTSANFDIKKKDIRHNR